MQKIIIGSRGSELALWQATFITEELKKLNVEVELKIIKTQGDKIQHLSFDKLEGKGFFTKELEDALLSNEIDLAVHSHKDLTTTFPDGLTIAAVSYRENPSELLLIRKEAEDLKQKFHFKKNAVVGTSSARRKSQLLSFRPDVEIKDLRGNVPTRIQKLRDGEYDAIMLAYAGVNRLKIDLEGLTVLRLDPKEFIPAPAQGVLGLQIRDNDTKVKEIISKLNDSSVQECIGIERKVLNLLDGGCQLPLGVFCDRDEDAEGNTVFKTYVSKADKWNEAPKYLYWETETTENVAQKIVERLHQIKPCSVFVTRDQRKNDQLFTNLTNNGFKVNMRSLIEMQAVPFKLEEIFDWVFFSSKHAVKFYFEQSPNLNAATKFGAISKATAQELRKFGKSCDFIGNSTDTKMVGKQFAALVGSKKVLFPIAKGSLKSIQGQFTKKEQVKDLFVYETIKKNEEPIMFADVCIFTSPSNVEAFFEKNKLTPEQKIIAMGDATAATLKRFGARVHKQPVSFDDLGLLQSVYAIC